MLRRDFYCNSIQEMKSELRINMAPQFSPFPPQSFIARWHVFCTGYPRGGMAFSEDSDAIFRSLLTAGNKKKKNISRTAKHAGSGARNTPREQTDPTNPTHDASIPSLSLQPQIISSLSDKQSEELSNFRTNILSGCRGTCIIRSPMQGKTTGSTCKRN